MTVQFETYTNERQIREYYGRSTTERKTCANTHVLTHDEREHILEI